MAKKLCWLVVCSYYGCDLAMAVGLQPLSFEQSSFAEINGSRHVTSQATVDLLPPVSRLDVVDTFRFSLTSLCRNLLIPRGPSPIAITSALSLQNGHGPGTIWTPFEDCRADSTGASPSNSRMTTPSAVSWSRGDVERWYRQWYACWLGALLNERTAH